MDSLLIKVLFSLACMTFAFGCQKSNEVTPLLDESSIQLLKRSQTEANNLIGEVAKTFAMNIDHQSALSEIISKASTQFDGQNNFLLLKYFDQTFSLEEENQRATTIGELFLHHIKDGVVADSDSLFELKAQISANWPLLNVFIPSWSKNKIMQESSSKDDILVAFIPREDSLASVPAYDSRGGLHSLDLVETPTQPVIVLNENDRVYALSTLTGKAHYDGHEINSTPFLALAAMIFIWQVAFMKRLIWRSSS